MSEAKNELPISFNSQMVRAILAGAKTQTRRVLKTKPGDPMEGAPTTIQCAMIGEHFGFESHDAFYKSPYGKPGDRLWVQEECRAKELNDKEAEKYFNAQGGQLAGLVSPEYGLDGVEYLADQKFRPIHNTKKAAECWHDLYHYRGLKSAVVTPRHMPRWASRINLLIKDVRVERLQNISDADCYKEGCPSRYEGNWMGFDVTSEDLASGRQLSGLVNQDDTAADWFSELWDSINKAKGLGWDTNPWVWVVDFEMIGCESA